MRFITLLLSGMGLFCLSSITASVIAEEVTPEEVTFEEISEEEPPFDSSEPLFDRMARFLDTPDDVNHAGLLGKNYFQSLALVQEGEDSYLRSFDEDWSGFDTFLNLAVTSPHSSFHLATDCFFGYSSLSFHKVVPSSTETWPWGEQFYHNERELNAETQAFMAGVTVYSDRGGRFRPFIQAGATLKHSQMVSTGGEAQVFPSGFYYTNATNNLNHTYNNHEVRALLNAGFEYDINSVLAYRLTLITETKGKFSDSRYSQDLILWPVNRFFLRFGGGGDLDNERVFANFGGGFAF